MQDALLRGAMAGMLALGLLAPLAATANSNNLLANGCSTRADCTNKIESSDLRGFFASHGVTAATLNDSVHGTVTRSGNVIVDGKVVATNAESFGRQFMPGSTQVGSVFRRHTSVSFRSDSLDALVHMNNGRFDFAILTSCGNLVIATPVAPAPKPKMKTITKTKTVTQQVTQQQPTPQPVTVTNNNTNTNTNENTNTVTVNQEQPTPTTETETTPAPGPTSTAAPAAAALPQTGPEAAMGLTGLSLLLTTSWYYYRSRRRLLTSLLHRTTPR